MVYLFLPIMCVCASGVHVYATVQFSAFEFAARRSHPLRSEQVCRQFPVSGDSSHFSAGMRYIDKLFVYILVFLRVCFRFLPN